MGAYGAEFNVGVGKRKVDCAPISGHINAPVVAPLLLELMVVE